MTEQPAQPHTPFLDVDLIWQQTSKQARALFKAGSGITALIGPSGAGKTSLARLIAGLDRPQGGRIRLGDRVLYHASKKRTVNAEDRRIGFVFQDAALLPHLTVMQNLTFSPYASVKTARKAATLTGIEPLLEREPSGLSGGEARRVAVARALASQPSLLILDEPFNGLHPNARADMMVLLQTINRQSGIPVLLISHQIDEILQLADEAILMEDGQASIFGPLEYILSLEKSLTSVGFQDGGSLISGIVVEHAESLCKLDIGGDYLFLTDRPATMGTKVVVRVRARDVALSKAHLQDTSILNQLSATVTTIVETENSAEITATLTKAPVTLKSRITKASLKALQLQEGQSITLLIKAASVKEIKQSTGT